MSILNHPPSEVDLSALKGRALNLRRKMMAMASGKGEGYIAQGLAMADCLASLYFHEMRYDPQDPEWPGRDRFVLSTGHYSIAMYAVLAEACILSPDELPTYGLNGSRLPMSTFDETPGVEMVGGSLGHGLGQAVGMAMGLRLDGSSARVFCEFSDGELQEGSTWEAAMAGATFNCDNLVVLVDCNGIQADGPVTVRIEPVADKLSAFGYETVEINGNSVEQLTSALAAARTANGKPKAIVMRTTPGFGIPTIMARDRAHFVRIDPSEWTALAQELETHNG
ncbi:transketolase subunit A [Rhizobium sp. PP-CC-3A-592]|nr:transketolase subunit A [Rhizobium sp. PP-CC-3A-592]